MSSKRDSKSSTLEFMAGDSILKSDRKLVQERKIIFTQELLSQRVPQPEQGHGTGFVAVCTPVLGLAASCKHRFSSSWSLCKSMFNTTCQEALKTKFLSVKLSFLLVRGRAGLGTGCFVAALGDGCCVAVLVPSCACV